MELIKKYFPGLSPEQLNQLAQLKPLYLDWNQKINVISRKDTEEFYLRHVLHSLSIAKITRLGDGLRVIDIGTGGGFPGIPLAILFPKAHFVLMDSIGKKIKVATAVITDLGLKNVEAVHGRAEEWKGEKFDLAVTRAVTTLANLSNWSRKVLKPDNQGLITLKGGDLENEIKEAKIKTKSWRLAKYFSEDFFETKFMTWSEVPVNPPHFVFNRRAGNFKKHKPKY